MGRSIVLASWFVAIVAGLSACGSPGASAPIRAADTSANPAPASTEEPGPPAADAAELDDTDDTGAARPGHRSGPFLDDDILAEIDRAALVVRIGQSGIAPDALKDADGAARELAVVRELPVVEEGADVVRVVHEEYGVRYGLYIEPRDLAERPAQRTALLQEPGDQTQPSSVELAGGAPVTIGTRRDGWTHVDAVSEGLSVAGWLPDAALARVFTREDFDTQERDDVLELQASTWILDRPNGQRIAELATQRFPRVTLHRVGPDHDGHTEIEATARRIRVRGFVPSDAVAPREALGYGSGGGGSGWGSSHTAWLDLPSESLLHTEPGGPVFAMTVEQSSTITLTRERQGSWVQVRFRTMWRMLPAWVECPALRRVASSHSHFECTEADDPERLDVLPEW